MQILLIRYILVILLGSCMAFAFPPHAVSYIVFVILTLFIFGLQKRFTKSSFWYGYSFYFGAVVAFIGYWFSSYFHTQLGTGYLLSYALTSIICFYTAFYIGIICFLYNKLRTGNQFFNLVVLFPSLWVLTELIRGLFFPRSWYVLGNIVVNSPLFSGFYPVFGVYFVSWLIVAIAGLICYFILYQQKSLGGLVKCLCVIIIGVSMSYLLSQIRYTKKFGSPIKVALIQPSVFSTSSLTEQKLLETEGIIEKLVTNVNASLIILPETIFGTDSHYLSDGYFDRLKHLTKGRELIFGSPLSWPGERHQTGVANIDNPDHLIYTKHYLVPFGEYIPLQGNPIMDFLVQSIGFSLKNYIPGSYIQKPMLVNGQKFAFNICYENTINDFVAKNAIAATILINQSDLSWYGKTVMKDSSLQFSQVRALENQRYFLQDGNTGDTVVINPMGQIEQKIPAFEEGLIITSVQGYSGTTPFEFMGNTPIWLLCCLVLLWAITKKFVKKSKHFRA
jgi:apolipoprotein N-acyltransferase